MTGARALATLLLACCAGSAEAQIVRGRVTDEGTGRPVGEASVALIDRGDAVAARTVTDGQGRFRLNLEAGGPFALRVERGGYSGFIAQGVFVGAREELVLDVSIAADHIVAAPIAVVGRRRIGERDDFESRLRLMRTARIGRSLVRSEIAERDVLEITDVLATLPDIVIAGPPRARTVRFAIQDSGESCAPAVFVNGRPLAAPTLDLVGTPQIIDAIELYNGEVEAPAEFSGISDCGILLVWTRPDPADARPVKWRRAVVYIAMAVVGIVLFAQ